MRNNESYLHTKISGWVTKLTFDIQALFLVIAIYTHISISGVVFWRINGWRDSSSSRAKSFTRSYSENIVQEHFWNWISHCSVKLWCANIPEDNHCLRYRLLTVMTVGNVKVLWREFSCWMPLLRKLIYWSRHID